MKKQTLNLSIVESELKKHNNSDYTIQNYEYDKTGFKCTIKSKRGIYIPHEITSIASIGIYADGVYFYVQIFDAN